MAHFITAASFASPLSVATAATRMVAVALRRVWGALANRRAVHGLREYDARMLKDIGLIPSDVDAALSCSLADDPSAHLASVAAGRWRRKA